LESSGIDDDGKQGVKGILEQTGQQLEMAVTEMQGQPV
jgi:hypothetical protein